VGEVGERALFILQNGKEQNGNVFFFGGGEVQKVIDETKWGWKE
jgi:hypothetical protein